jgi:RNA polymerase sigma factor (TIGR02999 family)
VESTGHAPGEITQLLHAWRAGSQEAEARLFELVLPDLRRMARQCMKGERRDHTLQPTELVNQVYFRLVAAKDQNWQNRAHFFAIAAKAMRRFLIDYARARPGGTFLPVDNLAGQLYLGQSKIELAIAVDALLDDLAKEHPDMCSVVELKFFLGLTDEETADVMGLSLRSMQRLWQDARRWLFEKLDPGNAQPFPTR